MLIYSNRLNLFKCLPYGVHRQKVTTVLEEVHNGRMEPQVYHMYKQGSTAWLRRPIKQYNKRIAIDIAGLFPETDRGNKYILITMDYFSKWPDIFAIFSSETTLVVEVLVEQVFSRQETPQAQFSTGYTFWFHCIWNS